MNTGSDSKNKTIIGCLIGGLIILVVIFMAVKIAWHEFLGFGMALDLSEYQETIEKIAMDSGVKDRIIFRIQGIKARVREGATVSFLEWTEIDSSILGLIEDRDLTDSEIILLERELEYIEELQLIE